MLLERLYLYKNLEIIQIKGKILLEEWRLLCLYLKDIRILPLNEIDFTECTNIMEIIPYFELLNFQNQKVVNIITNNTIY